MIASSALSLSYCLKPFHLRERPRGPHPIPHDDGSGRIHLDPSLLWNALNEFYLELLWLGGTEKRDGSAASARIRFLAEGKAADQHCNCAKHTQ
jgi:hypothetical protein